MPNLPKPRLRRGTRAAVEPHPAPASAESRIEEVAHGGLRWINIERPTAVDYAWLEEHFDFHPLAYEDVRSRNQRPKLDEYPEYLFIVLHLPVFDKAAGRLTAGELDIFLGPDYIITLPNQAGLQALQYLYERCRSSEELREALFTKGTGYLLYKIVDDSIDYCFPMLRKMGNKIDRYEEDLLAGDSQDLVRNISNVKQETINFRSIIRPQRNVLRDLERTKHRYVADDLDLYFDDIVDASERIWDMLETFKEKVQALEETNESVLSHRTNDSVRVLTSISIILLPLTLIASIFGMNVRVPGEGSITAFWIVILAMLVLLGGLVAYFKRHRFL
jgi:magnesium transporter